jgi:hypothetical protein
MIAGGEAIVESVPGGCHGCTYYTRAGKGSTSAQGLDASAEILKTKVL